MGDCLSSDAKEIIRIDPIYDEDNCSKAPPRELLCEQISRFLVMAQNDADIGKYFNKLNSYKIEELSLRICVMLNYAFTDNNSVRGCSAYAYNNGNIRGGCGGIY